MTRPERGMDHNLYSFSPIIARNWPEAMGRRQVYVYILLYLEYWSLQKDASAYTDPRFAAEYGAFFPEYRTWSYREYGNRVGIYRLLKLFDDVAVRPAVPTNGMIAEIHPEVLAEIARRGWEIIAHGLSADRMITSRMTAEEERTEIFKTRDVLAEALGCRPSGWLSQDYGGTERTDAILANAGFTYTLDWANDELPYFHNGNRRLLAIPSFPDFDDVEALWLRRLSLEHFVELFKEAVVRLQAESTGSRVLGIGVHPWMLGASHRVRYLREILHHLLHNPDVTIVTPGQIADLFFDRGANLIE